MGLQDDILYVSLLIFSIFVGHFSLRIQDNVLRKYLYAVTGFIMVVFVGGWDITHSLTTITINALIVKFLSPRVSHVMSFAWCFGYLAFFRTTTLFGFPAVAPHSNAVQLILTLKMVGLAFEVHDTYKLQQSSKAADADLKKLRYQIIEPSFLDVYFYAYCCIGILTGPYFKFRTYEDMFYVDQKSVQQDQQKALQQRIYKIPLYIAAFLLLFSFVQVQEATTEAFFEKPFWFRLFFMVLVFMEMRLRFYVAWLLAECVCICANLGVYPVDSKPRNGHGPHDLDQLHEFYTKKEPGDESVSYNYVTIQCIDEWKCELSSTVREGMHGWNMTVQYWLAQNVFKRLPHLPKNVRVAATMAVSAYWHGIHPGYYLSFLTIPINLLAEDLMILAYRKDRSERQQAIFNWICWFFKMRSFDYMSMGFLLLTFKDTVNYWGCIYYCCHAYMIVFIIIGFLSAKPTNKVKAAESKVNSKSDLDERDNDTSKVKSS